MKDKMKFLAIVGNGESETPCLLDIVDNYSPRFNYGPDWFAYGSVTNSVQSLSE